MCISLCTYLYNYHNNHTNKVFLSYSLCLFHCLPLLFWLILSRSVLGLILCSICTSCIFVIVWENSRKNGENVTSFEGMAFVARSLGKPWTGWIGPAPVQMSGCGTALSWLRRGLVQGLIVFPSPFVSSWIVTLIILRLGLGFLRARLLRLCAPLRSLQSFYNYARVHCEAARVFFRVMHSVHVLSVEQSNCACPRSANCSGVCWEEGMGGGGVLLFQEVGTMKSLYWRCEMWFNCVKRMRSAKLSASARAPRAFVTMLSFQACLRAFICTFCMCVCIYCVCVYVCGHVYMYIYACVYVFVHLCDYTHVYVYVYAYLWIDCGSQYQCFSVWTVSCMCICMRVHMYAYVKWRLLLLLLVKK